MIYCRVIHPWPLLSFALLALHDLSYLISFSLYSLDKKVPAIEIAGLCLPLKPQKENIYVDGQQNNFYKTSG